MRRGGALPEGRGDHQKSPPLPRKRGEGPTPGDGTPAARAPVAWRGEDHPERRAPRSLPPAPRPQRAGRPPQADSKPEETADRPVEPVGGKLEAREALEATEPAAQPAEGRPPDPALLPRAAPQPPLDEQGPPPERVAEDEPHPQEPAAEREGTLDHPEPQPQGDPEPGAPEPPPPGQGAPGLPPAQDAQAGEQNRELRRRHPPPLQPLPDQRPPQRQQRPPGRGAPPRRWPNRPAWRQSHADT